jgi:hypothetical protein
VQKSCYELLGPFNFVDSLVKGPNENPPLSLYLLQ